MDRNESSVLKCIKAPVRPDNLWPGPDLRAFSEPLRAELPSEIDPLKNYELAELIDLAERTNPETKVAWERARQAAATVGLAKSEYFPILALRASASAQLRRGLCSCCLYRLEQRGGGPGDM